NLLRCCYGGAKSKVQLYDEEEGEEERRNQYTIALMAMSLPAPPSSTRALFPSRPAMYSPTSSVRPARTVRCCVLQSQLSPNGGAGPNVPERNELRLGLPSKGRMADDTIDLLKDCQLSVRKVNPRQYVADIPQLSNLEVWFQRPKDIGSEDLIIVHDSLEFGDCRLSIAIPKYGIFENINSLEELARMPQWTAEKPLRVATGFTYLGPKFMREKGLKHVAFSTADGALEAAPAMGIADAILDLVSSGTTLRENNLKEIKGGIVLESQAVLVASKKSLVHRKGLLDTTHEIIERLEAHLRAAGQFTVVANMRGNSADEVAERVLSQPSLAGLQGPTVSPVFCSRNGDVVVDYYAIVICVPKKALYKSVQQLRAIGGSGVLVSPLTYIFDEETPRWRELLGKLGL
ncbi:ATP phosphoribosyltransferase 1, chloroplastic, partial [Linum perenne]